MKPALQLRVCQADYADPIHGRALVKLLDAYARDPMGGGSGLSDFARDHLVSSLAGRPQCFSVLAFVGADDASPVGLVNCVEGFSSFACRPLVNVHDVVVLPDYRGQRIAEKMLSIVELLARQRGACKLTLEVLSGNVGAVSLYHRVGFSSYQLDPSIGEARFLQKWLS